MKSNKITVLQYSTITFFLLNSFLMNIGYLKLTTTSYNDSILNILLGGGAIILFSIIIFKFQQENKNSIITTINKSLPKPISFFILIILFLIIGYSTIYSLTILTSFIHYYILKEISLLIILITLVVTVIYIVSKDISTIGKISEIFFYIYLLIFMVSTIGLIKYADFSNLKPLFITSSKNHLISSGIYFLSSMIPLLLLTAIPIKQVEFKRKNKNLPYLFISFSIILTFIQLISIISILGIQLTNIYQFPIMIIHKKISFLNVLERIETILAFNNILNSLFLIIMGVYFMKELTVHFISKKKEHIILALIGILLVMIGNLFLVNASIYLTLSNIIFMILVILLIVHYLCKYTH